MESFWAGQMPEATLGKMQANKLGKQVGQNKGKQFLANIWKSFSCAPLPKKGAGKQSHKGGCPEETQILFNETNCFGALFSVQLVSGLLKIENQSNTKVSTGNLRVSLAILK